jgi:hypothetical protein
MADFTQIDYILSIDTRLFDHIEYNNPKGYILFHINSIIMGRKPIADSDGRKAKSDVVQKVNDAEDINDAFEDDEDEVKNLMKKEIADDTIATGRIMAKRQRLEAQIELEKTQSEFNKSAPVGMQMGLEIPRQSPSWMKEMIELIPEEERADFIERNGDQMFKAAMGGGGFQTSSIYEALMARNKEKGNGDGDSLSGIAAIMAVMSDNSRAQNELMMEMFKLNQDKTSQGPTTNDMAKMMAGAVVEVGKVVVDAIKPVLEAQKPAQNNDAVELLRKEIQDLKMSSMEEKYVNQVGALSQEVEALKQNGNMANKALDTIRYLQDNGVNVTTETPTEMHEKNKYALSMKKLEMLDEHKKLELTAQAEEAKARQGLFMTLGNLVGVGATAIKMESAIKNGKNKGTKRLMEQYG